MAIKKIKKSESTLGGIVFNIIIAIFFFFIFFSWMQTNANQSGRVIEAKYNDSYNGLNNEVTNLQTTTDNIVASSQKIKEPQEGIGSAWNGLKGLLDIFKWPLEFLNIVWQSYQFMTSPLEGLIPRWIINLVALGILLWVIFIIISVFKGDSNVIR